MADDIDLIIHGLKAATAAAYGQFFKSRNPGNLTPAQEQAFQYRDMAYLLLFKAAQIELDAETELQALLAQDAA